MIAEKPSLSRHSSRGLARGERGTRAIHAVYREPSRVTDKIITSSTKIILKHNLLVFFISILFLFLNIIFQWLRARCQILHIKGVF